MQSHSSRRVASFHKKPLATRSRALRVRTRLPPRPVRVSNLATVAGPSGVICRLATVSDDVSHASPSPPMPVLTPGSFVNLSAAQHRLPDNVSVHTEDIDTSILDLTLSRPASVSSSALSLPMLSPSRSSLAVSRSPSPPPRQTSTPSVAPVPDFVSSHVGSFLLYSTVGSFLLESHVGSFRQDVVDK